MADATSKKKSGFGRNGLIIVGLRMGGAVMAYAVVLLLARWLDATSFGHYTLIMSAITFASVVSKLGTDQSLVRFLGIYRANAQPELAEGVVKTALKSVLVTTLILGVAAAVLIFFAPHLVGAPLAYGIAALILFPAFGLTDVMSSIIRSYGGAFSALAPKDVLWRIALLSVAGVIVLSGLPPDQRLVPVMLASGFILTGLTYWQFRVQKTLRLRKDGAPNEFQTDMPAWRQSAKWTWAVACARTLFRTFDVLTVGILLSPLAAGAYFAASRTAELLGFFLSALNLIVGPAVAHGTAQGNIKGTQRKLAIVALALGGTISILIIVFIFFGRKILFFMNPEFVVAYHALLILSVGQAVNVFVGSAGVVLNMTGYERKNAFISISSSLVTLVLLPILGPLYGMEGVAWAVTLGMSVLNIRTYIATLKYTPYDPSLLSIRFLIGKASK